MRVGVHRRQAGQDAGPHRFQRVGGRCEEGSEHREGVQVVPLPPPEPVRFGQAEPSAPRADAHHCGQAPDVRPVVMEDGQQVGVADVGRQAGLLGQLPHRCRLEGLSGLDAPAGQLPHAPPRPAEQHAPGAVGDHRTHPDNGLRLRSALLHRGAVPGGAAQHEDRQALRLEPLHLRPPLRQQADLLLVQRDMAPLLRRGRQDGGDHHQRAARSQACSEGVQDSGAVVQEGEHQAQGDQVVAVVAQLCRIVVLDVQAQPPHPLGARALLLGTGQCAHGEVDRIHGVAEFGEEDGEFACAAAQLQSTPTVRGGRVPGEQISLRVVEATEASIVVVVLGPVGSVVCHGALLVSGGVVRFIGDGGHGGVPGAAGPPEQVGLPRTARAGRGLSGHRVRGSTDL